MTGRMVALATAMAAIAVVLAAPGQAQTPRLPTDYHARVQVAGFDAPLEVRQSGLRRRIDLAEGGLVQSYIVDRARGMLIVLTASGRERLALVFPTPREERLSPLPLDLMVIEEGAARLNRVGASRIAGRACDRYRYGGYLGRSGTVCATREGIVLELHPDGRRTPLYQVLSLTPARQQPNWFTPSPDYRLAVLPGVGGGATGAERRTEE